MINQINAHCLFVILFIIIVCRARQRAIDRVGGALCQQLHLVVALAIVYVLTLGPEQGDDIRAKQCTRIVYHERNQHWHISGCLLSTIGFQMRNATARLIG